MLGSPRPRRDALAKPVEPELLISTVEDLFEELARSQEERLRRIATRIQPNLTDDDLLQPQDLPVLRDNPTFNYEDGILAGLRSAHIALRARILRPLRDGEL
jgi:hypothetical protein